MATTKLWKFKSRLGRLINYAINGEKTENKFYVSGINCMPDTAYQEMLNTKKQFFKTGGIECFHGYQSFATGEVTPSAAHEIGVKLAEKLWGDKFQVVVSTHLNTDNIHNHFVLNSVSFVDGKRFCNMKKDYALMRKTSDKLCEDFGLSVLKREEKYDKYASSSLYKELMKDSIDYAIANAKDFDEFISILKDLDYVITDKNNSLSIKRNPYKRNTRIERLFGKAYSKENICKRILEIQPEFPYQNNPRLLLDRTYKKYDNFLKSNYYKKGCFRILILHYEKLFDVNIESGSKFTLTRLSPELIKEIKKMDEYSEQIRFLVKNDIETEDQLIEFEKMAYEKIAPLKSQRENLWKKHKRAKKDEDKKEIENQIADISKRIYPVIQNIQLCKKILKKTQEINKNEIHQKLEQERLQVENGNKKNKGKVK